MVIEETMKSWFTKPISREIFSKPYTEPHDMETIGYLNGVQYINDSKSTNVNKAWYALSSTEKPIIWLAGGVQRQNLEPLKSQIHKVKAIICIGVNNLSIHREFGKNVDIIVNLTNMDMIVSAAKLLSNKGDLVLLSPGCASFDLYRDYSDRGNQFVKSFKRLQNA